MRWWGASPLTGEQPEPSLRCRWGGPEDGRLAPGRAPPWRSRSPCLLPAYLLAPAGWPLSLIRRLERASLPDRNPWGPCRPGSPGPQAERRAARPGLGPAAAARTNAVPRPPTWHRLQVLSLADNLLTGSLSDLSTVGSGLLAGVVVNVSRNALSEGPLPPAWHSATLQVGDGPGAESPRQSMAVLGSPWQSMAVHGRQSKAAHGSPCTGWSLPAVSDC